MNYSKYYLLLFFTLCFMVSRSQRVSINADGTQPDSSAILDLKSSGKGLLIPRMTQAERNAIYLPANGLMIYQTDQTPGFYYYNGNAWVQIISGNSNGYLGHYVGELFGGGIIVAVWKKDSVVHGLIASVADLSTGRTWSNQTNATIGTPARSTYDGAANSLAIIGQTGHTSSAASLCTAYTGGGFTDWYLPASWELNQCFMAAPVVNNILGATNGFQADNYWSSTESSGGFAFNIPFDTGIITSAAKSGNYRVRAVRKF